MTPYLKFVQDRTDSQDINVPLKCLFYPKPLSDLPIQTSVTCICKTAKIKNNESNSVNYESSNFRAYVTIG